MHLNLKKELPLQAMSEEKSTQLLELHGIKPTANRIVIVKALAAASRPLSLAELEQKILSIDKSNIFRALNIFKANRLVHVIESIEGTKYELCHSHHPHHDEDLHPHFYCERCQQTFCLDNMPLPQVDVPKGYTVHSINLIVKGICPECQSRKPHSK